MPTTSAPVHLALRSQDPALQQSITSRSDTTTGTVTGRVQSQLTGFALAFAVVELVSGNVAISSITDRFGRYRLESVPPGPRLVRARALDHAELLVGIRVPRGGHISLDLTLAVEPIEMAPLSARTSPVRLAEAGESDQKNRLAAENRRSMLAESERRMLDSSPGVAELGLLQVMQASAGPDAADPSSVLYVRGATSDLKLVLLDGAPVYAPFHLGGLIEAFMPNVLAGSQR
ncbi:MAG: carboxypeptidase-like regulatory domain-containing protein, partial [Gemmatimonadota bacterium]